ncbi:hypothetical protein [Aromatoleum sp.]|uniref:hypothetical protein n=1 Tax=Aromatoleum sp. TaxID=2307007 RepID=UPI002FC7E306
MLDVLEAADVPSGRISTAADIHEDPHYAAREMVGRFELPDGREDRGASTGGDRLTIVGRRGRSVDAPGAA